MFVDIARCHVPVCHDHGLPSAGLGSGGAGLAPTGSKRLEAVAVEAAEEVAEADAAEAAFGSRRERSRSGARSRDGMKLVCGYTWHYVWCGAPCSGCVVQSTHSKPQEPKTKVADE